MKIAIVAKGGTSALAPWKDEEWEIWGLPWISYPRVTRLFEVHEVTKPDFEAKWRDKAAKLYKGIPIYTAKSRMADFENAIELPQEAIKAQCKQHFRENSLCYMIGFAMHLGATDIALYGAHMMGRNDFASERAFMLYVLGVAEGRGINIEIAPGSPLFMSAWQAGRYGVGGPKRIVSMGGPSIAPCPDNNWNGAKEQP